MKSAKLYVFFLYCVKEITKKESNKIINLIKL